MQSITFREALALAEACHAKAAEEGLSVSVAVVDDGGHAVLLARMDQSIAGGVRAAEAKARTAVLYRRPTRAFAESYREGRPVHMLPDVMPLGGGIPIYRGGVLAGAVGVSGAVESVETALIEGIMEAYELAEG